MAKSARVVIGSAYGDEGKGLATDLCASLFEESAVVVRANGGAQAGHTVTAPDGRRHVFSHVGSGSFAGASTFLSRFFVSNPIVFLKERAQLDRLGVSPRVIVDPASPLSTPYDMMINQIAEEARGGARHGSCGIGFGETIERNLDPRFSLTVGDLVGLQSGDAGSARSRLARRLDAILTEHAPARLQALGVAGASPEMEAHIARDGVLERFLEDCAAFSDVIQVSGIACLQNALEAGTNVVFEGAQGLLLDQDRGAFPHVTRSNTGIRNVVALAQEAGIDDLEIIYATRAYTTRHGAGPLPRELPEKPYAGIVDSTNVTNAYQGALRFSHLDTDVLGRSIWNDLGDLPSSIHATTRLLVTCLDQIDGPALWWSAGEQVSGSPEDLARSALEASGLDALLVSRGPTRDQVSPLDGMLALEPA
jgi:adenylosuccinate synthase